MDISKIEPETLLSLYSIVFQDVTLFNNTIMENIRIGRKDATDEEVIAAARLANCEEFAAKLPDGYHSMIGENGCELSGGERQRISIARAFLKNSPIILLDEATASLDVENETLIQAALSRLIKDKTVLVIAHRMRTVSGADKVVVLSDGSVAEQGTPRKLMNTGKIYPHMVKLQMISGIGAFSMNNEWIICPICHSKTRLKIRNDTELKNFPLYCPKCKQETLISVQQMNISVIIEPDAKTQSR